MIDVCHAVSKVRGRKPGCHVEKHTYELQTSSEFQSAPTLGKRRRGHTEPAVEPSVEPAAATDAVQLLPQMLPPQLDQPAVDLPDIEDGSSYHPRKQTQMRGLR